MKKIISLLLFISLTLPFCLALSSCNPADGDGGSGRVRITDAFKLVYNSGDMREYSMANGFIEDFAQKYGVSLSKTAYTSAESEYEIQLGALKTRAEYISAKPTLDAHASQGIGVCVIRSTDKKLSVFASSSKALAVGIEELYKLIDDEGSFESGLDKLVIFDLKKYERTGEVVGYTLSDLAGFSSATSILLNETPLSDFSPEILEYSYEIAYKASYPVISVKPLSNSATVTFDQASEANDGIATVTITSADTESVTVYRIRVNMNYNHQLEAEIVNKGGASGAVCFVIDDGNQPTASFAKTMIEKYENLKLGFAIKGNSVATLKTTYENGELVYKMNDGKYTYTVNEANLNFWLDIKSTGRAEILNHTFTHAFHGTNDDGGQFEYVKNNEDEITLSEEFPKGSSTKEILATAQVLKELALSDSPLTLIHAGIGVRMNDYTVLGRKITTYKTYFNEVLAKAIEDGSFIGSRGTFTVTDDSQLASKIITPKMAYERRVSGVPAFMIEDYTDPKINSNPSYLSNLDSWKKHINNAIDLGGLACFCIHNISDTQQGFHHINKNQAEALFSYADSLAGELAIMNFTEAMKYYHEWSQATVTATAYKEEYIMLSVTDTLNNTVYDEALTVKVYIPDDFGNEATLISGSTETKLTINTDGDVRYILVDIVPDSEPKKIAFS